MINGLIINMKTLSEEQANEKFGRRWLDKCLDGKGLIKCADHRESIDEVLADLDEQLKPHGLEIVQIEMGGDTYYWSIEQRANNARKSTKTA